MSSFVQWRVINALQNETSVRKKRNWENINGHNFSKKVNTIIFCLKLHLVAKMSQKGVSTDLGF